MAHQSPMISIPRKATDDVDWTTPIRNLISQSYGENPDNYAAECAALQRCRQDAVKGAGSDMTARDLLYKYFGQLELLELRFSEIRVTFPWRDAFNNKLITQTSIAYEKASILFQIAVTHSSIAASQHRSDPEGLKRSFYYFRTCAGMLTYINENFLHAPSMDLSREVIKFLVNLILAQATEVFFEKCMNEKKGNALVSKIGAQVAAMYTSLCEEVKDFMGKGLLDRNWVTVIQIKSKYFTSLTQYYRAQVDNAAGKHGEALVRFTLAETLAKEASRSAANLAAIFVTHLSPNLPVDTGSSIQERTKAHLALCTERQVEATRENDLIYHSVLPSVDALPTIDKTAVATPIPIQEVYGTPDVQKVIGPDLFVRLIPLSVHESASVYSEEKAKLVRGEVEKAEGAEGEMKSAIDGLKVKEGLTRFKAIAEGEVSEEVPVDVRRWKEDIGVMEEREGVESLMKQLNELKTGVRAELEGVSTELDDESRECEMMRVKYEHLWTQEPSASLAKPLRQDLKSHFGALEAAAKSDQQVVTLWDSVKGDIALLLSSELEEVFKAGAGSTGESLLDLDVGNEGDAEERAKIKELVGEIEERLGRLHKIAKERSEVLKDLKDKIQADDVSHLLLLNRRNSGVEPTLFAAELEKFRPYQQRLAASVHHQHVTIQEVSTLWKGLKDMAGHGPGARRWNEREKKKNETVKKFSRARDVYMEVRDGLAKGLQFYTELTELSKTLQRNAKSFTSGRNAERGTLVGKAEAEKLRASQPAASLPPPPLAEKPRLPPPPPSVSNLNAALASLASMSVSGRQNSTPPATGWNQNTQAQPQTYYGNPSHPQQARYPAPAAPSSQSRASYLPPPPPPPPMHSQSSYSAPPKVDPYAGLGIFNYATPTRQNSNPPQPSSVPHPTVTAYQSHPPPQRVPQLQQQPSSYPSQPVRLPQQYIPQQIQQQLHQQHQQHQQQLVRNPSFPTPPMPVNASSYQNVSSPPPPAPPQNSYPPFTTLPPTTAQQQQQQPQHGFGQYPQGYGR